MLQVEPKRGARVDLQRRAALAWLSVLVLAIALGSLKSEMEPARAALEKQVVGKWKGRIRGERNPAITTAALIALARVETARGRVPLQLLKPKDSPTGESQRDPQCGRPRQNSQALQTARSLQWSSREFAVSKSVQICEVAND